MIVLENATVFDGQSPELLEGASVIIEGDRIKEVAQGSAKTSAERIDLAGRTLMPGLIDAHYHALLADLNPMALDHVPPSLLHQYAHRNLTEALDRGFTTVRDAGGADVGLARAVEQGLIKGPRIFFSGKALSQTGGHGDLRPNFDVCACAGYRGPITAVADGVDEVRRAVREELRHGATQIKLMVSGGVLSPSDPVWMDQYSDDEIRAAVEETATRRTYVMAHAHPASAVKRCVTLGVRSIEHGTLIDDEGARMVAAAGVFVVPTLVTIYAMLEEGRAHGLPEEYEIKLKEVADQALGGLERLKAAGAKIALGTDLIGPLHKHQSREFLLRAEVLSPFEVLHSATAVNAELLNRVGELGTIAAGARADLIALDGNPLDDLNLLQEQGRHMPLVMKGGALHRNRI